MAPCNPLRQAERVARLAEAAEAKAKARSERELRFERVAANQMLSIISGTSKAKAGARLSSVCLDAASITGGWGMHEIAIGDRVEVKLKDVSDVHRQEPPCHCHDHS
jgi:hypothetical protein